MGTATVSKISHSLTTINAFFYYFNCVFIRIKSSDFHWFITFYGAIFEKICLILELKDGMLPASVKISKKWWLSFQYGNHNSLRFSRLKANHILPFVNLLAKKALVFLDRGCTVCDHFVHFCLLKFIIWYFPTELQYLLLCTFDNQCIQSEIKRRSGFCRCVFSCLKQTLWVNGWMRNA